MALTSSLYSGVSGLINMGNAMQVIGDNISNVNTNGFKGARATFQDIMAQSINTARGGSQVGRGSAMSDVAPLFTQGSFESTTSSTDLAIAGNGFFMLSNPKVENSIYFSRSGQFHVDKEGYLVNPAGLTVQGWEMEEQADGTAEIIGSIQDIQIVNTSPPVATTQATVAVNLDSRTTGPVSNNSLIQDWNDQDGSITANVHYEYKTTFNVYDSLGNTHAVTVYFDMVDADSREWEFIVTCDPDEDKATTSAGDAADPGLLMSGHLTFTPEGQISNTDGIVYSDLRIYKDSVTGETLDTAAQPDIGEHGYPELVAFFLPPSGDGIAGTSDDSSAQLIEMNFGAKLQELDSDGDGTTDAYSCSTEAISTTQFANRSSTIFYDQNGFGSGFLEALNVDSEGVISGSYSNGRIIQLAQLALARFNSPTDLSKEGGSLWRETTASGAPITGPPRTNGLGTIAANALEQSTVDMGTEFVKLITTQRAFQANSKVITTTDEMLQELLTMKR